MPARSDIGGTLFASKTLQDGTSVILLDFSEDCPEKEGNALLASLGLNLRKGMDQNPFCKIWVFLNMQTTISFAMSSGNSGLTTSAVVSTTTITYFVSGLLAKISWIFGMPLEATHRHLIQQPFKIVGVWRANTDETQTPTPSRPRQKLTAISNPPLRPGDAIAGNDCPAAAFVQTRRRDPEPTVSPGARAQSSYGSMPGFHSKASVCVEATLRCSSKVKTCKTRVFSKSKIAR